MTQVNWIRKARAELRDCPAEGIATLREAIRRRVLAPSDVARAGELALQRAAALPPAERLDERILVLGQCTTTWLTHTIAAAALADGPLPRVIDGAYDNVVGELLSPETAELRPTTVVLLPWNRSLLAPGGACAADRVGRELELWGQVWELVRERHGARIVQVGYDWMHPGALGYHLGSRPDGGIGLVRAANEALRGRLPPNSFFVDLPAVSGDLGRRSFYDARRYFWTRQPFSEEGVAWLGMHAWAGVRALRTGPRKALVLDLDNTLWGGVVGELGPLGVALGESADGEAYREFQRFLAGLNDRGILLAVASKNNEADAREPFEKNVDMVLSMDRIAAFEAHWDPKPGSIARVAETLRIGRDALVFVDDSAVEREHVRQALPEVAVVDLGADPADYARAVVSELWFEAAGLTTEDAARAQQYRGEAQRDQARQGFSSMEEYLASLEMVGAVKAVEATDLMRVTQLIAKTNQFNLTTRRHTREQVSSMLATPGSICLALTLRDRFGDYGLVGVLLSVPGPDRPDTLELDTFLLSCRALGRTVEDFLYAGLLARARAAGVRRLTATYLPTAKNGQVRDLYPRLGFHLQQEAEDGTRRFELDLAAAPEPRTWVREAPASPAG